MATDLGSIPFTIKPTQNGNSYSSASKPTLDTAQASLAQSQSLVDKYHAEDAAYKQAAQVANAPGTIAKKTVAGTVGTLLNGPVKALRSGAQAVGEMFGANFDPNQTYTDFSGTPQKTLQGEVYSGDKSVGQATGEFALDTASILPTAKIGGLGVKAAEKAPGVLSKLVPSVVTDYLAKRAEKKLTQTAVQALTPKMTARETEEAVARGLGTVKGGKAAVDMTKDKNFMEMVGATRDLVKGKSAIEDTNAVRSALKSEATDLENKVKVVQQPVSSKGVKTWLDSIQKPIEIESDASQSKKFDLTKSTLMKIVDKNLGENSNVGSLLKSRKEFDDLVQKEFPNLYDRENAPFRNAVKSMRDALNNDIEANLPDGFGYKESLKKQRMFYDAIDNLSSQAPKEIKGTATWGQRHPVLKNVGYGVGAYGALEANKVLKDNTGVGVPTPF